MEAGKCLIIAEAGVNHNGSIDTALKLIETAARAGADVVKFQTFKAESLVSKSAPMAEYQKKNLGKVESQHEMLKKLELPFGDHKFLAEFSSKNGIEFLSTAFDEDSLDFLIEEIGIKRIKVPSGEITNGPFLLHVAKKNLPIILSTGMATLGQIEDALAVIAFGQTVSGYPKSLDECRDVLSDGVAQKRLNDNVTILHCTTEYPAPPQSLNLSAITTIRNSFGLSVGYSDHSQGIIASIAAVALGSTILEKHFTLDRTMEGPDHAASLEPGELNSLVDAVRETEQSMGSGRKIPTDWELKNSRIARRSLVILEDVNVGDAFSKQNLGYKRPGTGLSPMNYWNYMNSRASKKYAAGDQLSV